MKVDPPWADRWAGRTVVCIASGPSLTPEDCEAVRAAGHPAIVTNTTFRACPWADVLFGHDSAWWKEYGGVAKKKPSDGGPSVADVFRGERVTCSIAGRTLQVRSLHNLPWFQGFGNSGTAAISLAIAGGARRILLLGYDCKKSGERVHWHGDHPKQLGNAASLKRWPRHFANVAKHASGRGVEVLNCSRETALDCFPRAALADAL